MGQTKLYELVFSADEIRSHRPETAPAGPSSKELRHQRKLERRAARRANTTGFRLDLALRPRTAGAGENEEAGGEDEEEEEENDEEGANEVTLPFRPAQ